MIVNYELPVRCIEHIRFPFLSLQVRWLYQWNGFHQLRIAVSCVTMLRRSELSELEKVSAIGLRQSSWLEHWWWWRRWWCLVVALSWNSLIANRHRGFELDMDRASHFGFTLILARSCEHLIQAIHERCLLWCLWQRIWLDTLDYSVVLFRHDDSSLTFSRCHCQWSVK